MQLSLGTPSSAHEVVLQEGHSYLVRYLSNSKIQKLVYTV